MNLTESDWRYLRSIHDEILATLCDRINAESLAILQDGSRTAHERYQDLYVHIRDARKIIARCFYDNRRSKMREMIESYRFHGLLTDEHVRHLSEDAQQVVRDYDQWHRDPGT